MIRSVLLRTELEFLLERIGLLGKGKGRARGSDGRSPLSNKWPSYGVTWWNAHRSVTEVASNGAVYLPLILR